MEQTSVSKWDTCPMPMRESVEQIVPRTDKAFQRRSCTPHSKLASVGRESRWVRALFGAGRHAPRRYESDTRRSGFRLGSCLRRTERGRVHAPPGLQALKGQALPPAPLRNTPASRRWVLHPCGDEQNVRVVRIHKGAAITASSFALARPTKVSVCRHIRRRKCAHPPP